MIIEIRKPELESLICDRMENGEFQNDEDFVVAAFALVILAEFRAQTPRFYSNDGIYRWIERLRPVEDFDADRVLLQAT